MEIADTGGGYIRGQYMRTHSRRGANEAEVTGYPKILLRHIGTQPLKLLSLPSKFIPRQGWNLRVVVVVFAIVVPPHPVKLMPIVRRMTV